MHEIIFRLESEELGGQTSCLTINPYIDGVHLRELARAAEFPFAAADGQPDLAGAYAGLVANDRTRWPSRHFLGEPVERWFSDATILLGCTCGEPGCWPLTAHVEVGHGIVEWRGFRTGHREWDLSGIGPFRFSRERYEAALVATSV